MMESTMGMQIKIKRKKDLVWEKTEKKTIVIDVEKGIVYELNQVASDIWKLISRYRSISEIAKKLSIIYSEKEKIIAEDVIKLISTHKDLFIFDKKS